MNSCSADYFNNIFTPVTLVELLNWRARHQPEKMAYRFLVDGRAQENLITYAELEKRARAFAARLQAQTQAGDRVLILYPPGLDYIAAFFGCLYAGVIAVTAYPPRLNRPARRLKAIIADSGAVVALSNSAILDNIQRRFEHHPEMTALNWINGDEIPVAMADDWTAPEITADSIAFLQYTSGSTGSPRGVMITHDNLLQNMKLISHGFQIGPNDSSVFWLPLYHDMGLIGGILTPMYVGGPSTLLSSDVFLQRPLRWLQAITRYQATISGAPNFAYQMCLDRIPAEHRAELNLESWRIAFCGAEPIHPETIRRFSRAFGACGLPSNTFYPCYGLAEATLLVSGGEGPGPMVSQHVETAALAQNSIVEATDKTTLSQELVSCGVALLDQEIVIVKQQSLEPCAANEVGEVWVSGRGIARGYWQRPEATAEIFSAKLATGSERSYLRTGDLGYVHEGHLYITGRQKDLIIIRGRNHYPQDIEHTVADCHAVFQAGMGAAFSIQAEGEERLVVVHEVARRYRNINMAEIVTNARRAVAREHEVQLHALVLVRPLSIAKTSSGKIMRFACKSAFLNDTLKVIDHWSEHAESYPENLDTISRQDTRLNKTTTISASLLESWLVSNIAAALKSDPRMIDIDQPFVDHGLDSVQAVTLAGRLEGFLKRPLESTLVWDYPTIRDLANHLAHGTGNDQPVVHSNRMHDPEPIAVIGLACRFPGAVSAEAYWRLLADGVDAISEVPADRWDSGAFFDTDSPAGKMNTRWGGFLENIDQFDPGFFGISPREATRMDPQQRLILELSWEALENAGQAPGELAGSNTAVFVGISSYDYSRLQFSQVRNLDIYAGTGNAHSIAANRLSYLLDLRGPSMAIDTACSSSLMAVHLACQSLRYGESNMAIAGGVNLILSPEMTVLFSQGKMMASDGRCKTFDARADGYVRSEGCGVVILKRLSEAIRDRDRVMAVIRGSAANQDGRSNGLTAPNGLAQQSVIQQALANSAVKSSDISYIEAHGTGTLLGDPIEIQALRAVYEKDRSMDQTCLVGSAKTSIGHLEAAAGIASLIKVILSLQHGEIPAHLHYQSPNPHIDLSGSALHIAKKKQPWPRSRQPRMAGVSSFGFGGTNVHMIVGDAPQRDANENATLSASALSQKDLKPVAFSAPPKGYYLLVLSARQRRSLTALAAKYCDYLQANKDISLADICFTANTGRSHFDHRLAVTSVSHSQMQKQLQAFVNGHGTEGLINGQKLPAHPPIVAYIFSAEGAHYPRMGLELYQTQVIFRSAIDQCANILENYLDVPLLEILYPPQSPHENPTPDDHILNTLYSQPALFAIEYALVELWRSWGIEADVVMGGGGGEITAACIAGVYSLEDGLRLVTGRARLMQSVSQEEMTSPRLTMTKRELDEFESVLGKLEHHEARIPLVSGLTGALLDPGETPDIKYWRRRFCNPVQLGKSVETLAESGANIIIEIGPDASLLKTVQNCLSKDAGIVCLPSLLEKRNDSQVILDSLGAVYTAGVMVNWQNVGAAANRQKVALPGYQFSRQRYWIDVADVSPVTHLPIKPAVQESRHETGKGIPDQVSRLQAIPEAERQQVASGILVELTARVLELQPEHIAVDEPLDSYGLDSLIALDLKTEIEASLGISVAVENFLLGPTLTELTTQLIDRLACPETDVSSILPVSEAGKPHPLSYNQQALWFLHELLPKGLSFNVAGAVRIRGRIEAVALREAFQKLITRHSILRTTITESQGRPTQQVQTAITTPFQEISALDWDEDAVENYLVEEAYSPFDLENGPIIRMRLLAREGHEHILLMSVDHIVVDLWSVSVLVQELYQLYQAGISGQPVKLPPLEIQYADYVYWEADFLKSAAAEQQRAYWLEQLGGELPVLDLPTDRPRYARQTYAGDTVNMLLDNDLVTRLRALGQAQGATLYMTLLAGFQTLLHRYSGQDHVMVGSVLAGRDRPELARQIGYFINPVILSADFSGNPGFERFLQQVRQRVLGAFANQHYPLPLLAEGLSFVRDPSRPPLFETMFIMQKTPRMDGRTLGSLAPGMPKTVFSWDELDIESIRLPHMPAQFDLTLMASELDDGLGVALHYNSDLFERSTVTRMLAHFATLLTAIVADPKQPVSTIPLLTTAEQQQMASVHDPSKRPDPGMEPVYQLIENQIRRTPEATAIVYRDISVTYDQLNRLANQVAHMLVEKGVSTGKLVGIYMNRGVDMVAGILGVLKTGGAYLPLDPAFPAERLAIMIADAQPRLVLTQVGLESDLRAIIGSETIVSLDGDQRVSAKPDTNPAITVQADDLAYVIFTSGSTGRPKGVMVTHRNLSNILSCMQNRPGLKASDRVLAVTTLSFDIAALEIFLPLMVGAKLVIATGTQAKDGLLLQQLMASSHTTFMQATPATWQLLLEAGWMGDKWLKILCGGEVLPRELANRLLQRSRQVWNMYGPTETTIWSTSYRVLPGEGPVPIGVPIANTRAYVLDRQMQAVPRGMVGDLYIAGDGVTQGYLNQPELTAEKFIPHSFKPSGRLADADTSTGSASMVLYKTGDRVRLLNDGNLMFIGRDDQQVKLRGYRIEPGEIESALEQFEGIEQAIVVSRDLTPQNKQLVAYLLLHKDTELIACETLRSFLHDKLPGYMIPAAFVVIDKVPLTPAGKTDRKSLPAPAPSNPEFDTGYVPPRTPMEQQIADLCAAVLGVDKVGMYDNFFDSGGNSLLATRLVFQLREALQVPLPLRLLFADPTVSGICKSVMAMQANGDVSHTSITGEATLPADMSLAELNAEAMLDELIPDPGLTLAPIKAPGHILLTGATGFVGAFLLSDLLLKTGACVHCLVRAESVASGKQRLREKLEAYQLWQEAFNERIRIVPGDLTQQRLGLEHGQFNELAQCIDVIYHAGAMVNFVYSFQTLKDSNVLGTQEVLRLAGTRKLKAVHFVSTLSVLHTGAHDDGAVYFEDDDLDQVGVPFGNYAKSKWVAEKIVMEAGRRGIPIAIYRPGLISGHSKTAETNTADLMSSLLLVCLTTGCAPELNIMVDVVPVDYVTGAIVQISLGADVYDQVFHVSNPQPGNYKDIVKTIISLGYKLKLMPFNAWRDHLIDLSVQLGGGSWDAFLPLLEEAEVEQAFMPAFDCRNSLAALGGSDVSCAAVDADLLRLYLTYFKRNGFI